MNSDSMRRRSVEKIISKRNSIVCVVCLSFPFPLPSLSLSLFLPLALSLFLFSFLSHLPLAKRRWLLSMQDSLRSSKRFEFEESARMAERATEGRHDTTFMHTDNEREKTRESQAFSVSRLPASILFPSFNDFLTLSPPPCQTPRNEIDTVIEAARRSEVTHPSEAKKWWE